MAKRELTDGIVKTLPVPKKGLAITRDTKVPGFGVRVLAKTGTASWVLAYTSAGRRFLYTLALCTEMKCGPARAMAIDYKRRIKHDGFNPALEQKEKRDAPTVDEIADDFLASIRTKPSHYDTKNGIDHDVRPAWGKLKAATITPEDVAKLHKKITARCRTGRRANMVADFIYRVFDHAKISPNPAQDLQTKSKRNPEPARERVLSLEEMQAVWAATDKLGGPHGAAVKLLMLTAQRRGEVAGLLRSELNAKAGEWNLPASRTKNRRPHSVPVVPTVFEIVAALPRIPDTDRVFPADLEKGFSYFKECLDAESAVTNWCYHDLRRSVASHLGDDDLGVDPIVIEKLLNHHQLVRGVAAIYNRAKLTRKLRAAVDSWGRYLLGQTNVIQIRA